MEAWCLLLLLALPGGGAQDEALQHLLRGNELAGKGRHLEAIAAWRFALHAWRRVRYSLGQDVRTDDGSLVQGGGRDAA
jgi:hypothetical protein